MYMNEKIIRMVKDTDAQEILSIYAHYIKETAITFEYEVPTLAEFTKRIREISSDYPYLVCWLDGNIIGYAYAHRQMERAAYQWNAELSVYIDKSHLHHGIGKALYSALIEILQMQNMCNLYGSVTSPNKNSEKLHEAFGFSKLGIYHKTGYKCGAWHDVIWFEKNIGDCSLEPEPFISIQKISKNAITEILSRISKTSFDRNLSF